jgi:hypothetical protein
MDHFGLLPPTRAFLCLAVLLLALAAVGLAEGEAAVLDDADEPLCTFSSIRP